MANRWPPELPWALPEPYAHYILVKKLGKGGQGDVFQAVCDDRPYLPPTVAIKFLKHVGRQFEAAFMHEAGLGILARSPHVGHTLEVIDLREQNGLPPFAIVMECYDASLQEVLKRFSQEPPFVTQQIIHWVRQLARAIKELHTREQPMVHRDIKPANIMFRCRGGRRWDYSAESLTDADLVLADLGAVGRPGQVAALTVGWDHWKEPELYPVFPDPRPPNWVPPTQAFSTAMDIFSLGKVLLEFAKLCNGDTHWLEEAAAECVKPVAERPKAREIIPRLSIDWDDQIRAYRDTGYRPEDHAGFIGREFIVDEIFEEFAASCRHQGGAFVLVGPAGIGKTALLTNWSDRSGQIQGYYFRYRDNRIDARQMPEQIARQLRLQFNLPAPEGDEKDNLAGLLERLCEALARRPDRPERLLLFVDGLDEADNATEAANFIPKRLPPGMFVIASSRPPAKDKDHLASLRSAGARIFELKADDPRNLDNVMLYFEKQLNGRLRNGQAQTLAKHCGGIFLLAKLLVEAIDQEQLTLEQALVMSRNWLDLEPERRLAGYYQESWVRICAKEKEVELAEFAALMAAARGWISEDLVGRILRWHDENERGMRASEWRPGRVRQVCRSLTWFLERREEKDRSPFYQIRHQSVRDYLLSADGPVASAGLAEMNNAIARYFQSQAEDQRGWANVEPYGRYHVVQHLLAACGEREYEQLLPEAIDLLTNHAWIQATLGDAPAENCTNHERST